MVIDDLGHKDLSYFGSELHTPALDDLAKSAIKFTQFSGQPICSPSRAALLTGLYGYNSGAQSMFWPWVKTGLNTNLTIIPQILKSHGYKNYMVGKWHLGFFKPEYRPNNRGFDYHYGSYAGWVDYFAHTNYGNYDLYENDKIIDKNNIHITELHTKQVINQINQHNLERPFFMYIAFNAPHSPYQNIPYWENYLSDFNQNLPNRKGYGALLCHLDYCIGKIIHNLKKKNMFDNTYIWVTSDNGGTPSSDNSPLKGCKTTFYEGGLRVANFLLGPDIKPAYNNEPHHVVDIMPTALKLLNLPLNINIDGFDIFGTQPTNRSFIYQITKNNNEITGCIRKNNHKLLKYKTLEMYDLKNDPYELNNISSMPEKEELLQELKDLSNIAKFENSNAWHLRPNKAVLNIFDNEELSKDNSMESALGLAGFTSINN